MQFRRPRTGLGKPYQPRIGLDFEIEQAPAIEARTRDFLTRSITILVGTSLAASGTYGVLNNNYTAVEIVWAIDGPLLGAMVTYFFGPYR